MAAHQEDSIQAILNSPLKDILVKGFAELYRTKPNFPIEFLGRWLKNYSHGQRRQKELEESKGLKEERVAEFQKDLVEKERKAKHLKDQIWSNQQSEESEFNEYVRNTKYQADLLVEYLPEAIERTCDHRGTSLTGCYIGELKHRHKKLEEHNFQPGAQFDTETPKVIQYIGSSKSHKFMVGKILLNETGRSYEVFKEEEAPVEELEEDKKAAIQKKKYLYVPMVQRDQKMYFFRFPKLGSFACFPLRLKSCLYSETFDKGIGDYKAWVKSKEESEKEYSDKLNEARGAFEEAKRKFQEHEGNEEDANFQVEHTTLKEEMTKTEQALQQIEATPPVIENFKYQTKSKDYVISVDTMGKDTELPEDVLSVIEKRIEYFREIWEGNQSTMLLDDILRFITDQQTLQNLDNYFRDQERSIVSANESQIKEQYVNKEKEAEYELTLLKIHKLLKILHEDAYINSMTHYFSYNIPKYKEVIQIVLMLLGSRKEKINLPRSNSLDHRECLTKEFVESMLADLEKYELRRESSESVESQYKINKLLERLEKVDSEAIAKYNCWLYGLLVIAKNICWARIQCRDAKIEAHEAKIKAMNERDADITKYQEDMEKALEAAKAELNEETLPTFSQQDWRKNYSTENIKLEKLFVQELKLFLDIE